MFGFRALSFVAFALFVLLVVPIQAQRSQCTDGVLEEFCGPERQRTLQELYGVVSIEVNRAAGDQVRRVFYVDGYGTDTLAVSFLRARGKEPTVSVYLPRKNGQSVEPLVATVPEDTWNDVLERSHYFDRRLVALPPADTGLDTICMHAWTYTVEATDPQIPGRAADGVRRMTDDTCGVDGLVSEYARFLADSALSLLSYCRGLDARLFRNTATMLETCGRLRGDRNAAAVVMNRMEELQRAAGLEHTVDLRHFFFGASAVLDWNGERREGDVTDFWTEQFGSRSPFHMEVDRATGEHSRNVRVEGRVVRVSSARRDAAPLVMIWGRDHNNDFVIESVKVGAFTPVPEP